MDGYSHTDTHNTYMNIDHWTGTATVFISLTMVWKDPRLAWEVEDGGTCANFVTTWTGHVSYHDTETCFLSSPDISELTQDDLRFDRKRKRLPSGFQISTL